MRHHAYVIEGGVEEGIRIAGEFIAGELQMRTAGNPDVVILRYGLLSAEEAREIADIAAQGAVAGEEKAIIVAAGRAYHEAQNALLKIFEEPPPNTYLFLILPSLGSLLPTLRSRVEILPTLRLRSGSEVIAEPAKQFLAMTSEKRSAYIKKLATGRDEEERREHRDEALAIVNGIEAAAAKAGVGKHRELLADIATLRGYLHDRSAPVRMILEHLSLVLPRDLV